MCATFRGNVASSRPKSWISLRITMRALSSGRLLRRGSRRSRSPWLSARERPLRSSWYGLCLGPDTQFLPTAKTLFADLLLQTHCLTETFFPEAFERARYLDSYLAREGKVVGPLHGLPVSLKVSRYLYLLSWRAVLTFVDRTPSTLKV